MNLKKLLAKFGDLMLLSVSLRNLIQAFMSGMELSSGDSVVLLDGDLQDPPELIENFIKRDCGYDVAYGIRTKEK